jgi:hypothetical protein
VCVYIHIYIKEKILLHGLLLKKKKKRKRKKPAAWPPVRAGAHPKTAARDLACNVSFSPVFFFN